MRGCPSIKQFSRGHDERVLAWLQLRDEGYSTRQIARFFKVSPGSVQRATAAALEAAE